jgi:uracil-DNA glycosylase family protein
VRTVTIAPTFEAWQATARRLLREAVPPGEVRWQEQPDAPPPVGEERPGAARVPRRFLELARQAAGARDPARWAVLYEVLWRLVHERAGLLAEGADPQLRRLVALAAQGRRQAERGQLAEALVLESQGGGAAPFVPAAADLPALRAAAARCTGCPLYRTATQTVFGLGPADARVVLVGEQPGDQEDLTGAPFVGPAGEVLDRALAAAGLARGSVYVTNAVKHFKFVERGKRRIHQTPSLVDVAACRPWLEAELALIKPATLVCLGATAARAVFGPDFRLMRDRGRFLPSRFCSRTLATLHPSAVLRGQDEAEQERLYRTLAEDLRLVARTAA